jgi:hypothetical protein
VDPRVVKHIPNIIIVAKSGRIQKQQHVECMEETRYAHNSLIRLSNGKNYLQDSVMNWRIILP